MSTKCFQNQTRVPALVTVRQQAPQLAGVVCKHTFKANMMEIRPVGFLQLRLLCACC